MPIRIQRKRTKGWKFPDEAVYVGRPSDFGNPFSVNTSRSPGKTTGGGYIAVPTLEDALECFRLYVQEKHGMLDQIRKELRGKDLACWCPLDQACHADVLLELANADAVQGEGERNDG